MIPKLFQNKIWVYKKQLKSHIKYENNPLTIQIPLNSSIHFLSTCSFVIIKIESNWKKLYTVELINNIWAFFIMQIYKKIFIQLFLNKNK